MDDTPKTVEQGLDNRPGSLEDDLQQIVEDRLRERYNIHGAHVFARKLVADLLEYKVPIELFLEDKL